MGLEKIPKGAMLSLACSPMLSHAMHCYTPCSGFGRLQARATHLQLHRNPRNFKPREGRNTRCPPKPQTMVGDWRGGRVIQL